MHRIRRPQTHLRMLVPAVLLLLSSSAAKCQDAAATPPAIDVAAELKSLVAAVNQLQSQMQTLNSQMTELRASQQQAVLRSGTASRRTQSHQRAAKRENSRHQSGI